MRYTHEALIRGFWIGAGGLSLALGVIGIFLPILPTVPFILFSAFCFSKGSKRLHQWMLDHRIFGPWIRDWDEHGRIPTRAKIFSTAMLAFPCFYVFWLPLSTALRSTTLILVLTALLFIWTRPSLPYQRKYDLLRYLKVTGYIEGISLLVLMGIAMPLKYIFGIPTAVQYFGWIHGILFLLYLLVLGVIASERHWPIQRSFLGILAAVVPFGVFILHRKVFTKDAASR